MKTNSETKRSKAAKLGWGILLGLSAVLLLAGLNWYAILPQMALENIAEYAGLQTDVFTQGNPSSFDVITIIARGYGVGYAGLGLLALLVALEGYRHGTRWAWTAMWVLVLVYAGLASSFRGEAFTPVVLAIGGFALLGLLMARRDLTTTGRSSDEGAGFQAE